MKTNRIKLYHWFTNDVHDVIEVDWPKVHSEIGTDQLDWILKQAKSQCQLVVDKLDNDFALVAEFYDEQLLTTYHLMWAK
jgi:hypothetical protein